MSRGLISLALRTRGTYHSAVRFGRPELLPFFVGFASLPIQAILLREMLGRGAGNELSVTIYLAAWLAGSATGAHFWGRAGRFEGPAAPQRSGRILSVALSGAAVGLVLIRWAPQPGNVQGQIPGPLWIGLLAAVTLWPLAFLTAGVFPLAARSCATPGLAYRGEALGAVLGGLLVTILLIARMPPIGVLSIILAIVLFGAGPRRFGAPVALLLITFTFLGGAARLDHALFRQAWEARHPGLRLEWHAITPSRTLAVAEREGARWLLSDDEPLEVIQDPYEDEAVAALLLAAAPRVDDVLLVGFGGGGVGPALLQAGARRILCLLLEREDTLLVPPTQGILYKIGDPRQSLKNVQSEWDVVAVAGAEPINLAANRLWTREAFAQMKAALRPGGSVVAILPGGPAAVGRPVQMLRMAIARAMEEAIGRVEAVDADRFVLLASTLDGGAGLAPDSLKARFSRSGRFLPTFPPERFVAEYPSERRVRINPAPSNRDARPAAVSYALLSWARRSGLPIRAWPQLPWIAGLLAILVLVRPWKGRTASAATGVLIATGATSMGLDILLLMTYQSRVGLLQGGMGVLLGSFLAGTGVGAALASRMGQDRRFLIVLCLVQSAVAVLGADLLVRLPAAQGMIVPTILFAIGAAILGTICGLPFPCTARLGGTARAWSADAAGGILGALLVLFFIGGGIRVAGLCLAALPLLAMTRFLGSGGRMPGKSHP